MSLLAEELRPKKLEDIYGQEHLIGENKVLSNLIKNKKIFSMILYGRPGIGKTSIANAISNELGIKTVFLNAVINNKSDFDNVINNAKNNDDTLVIIDEIHRMNKDKQDLLLPHIESGLIKIIGLTTSNPYHSINPAIRSRCHIFELKELTINNIIDILKNTCNNLKDIKIDDDTLKYISTISSGDVRSAINIVELAYYSTFDKNITIDVIRNLNNNKQAYIDKNDDGYYDVLSCLQKSIRGSDPDAAVHYLARLLLIGDLESIARRLSVIAYEDIGLANISIGSRVDAAINNALRVGMPEARIIFAEIVIEMALSPKSNSAYLAITRAMNDINEGYSMNIPKHLKNHSPLYLYPHDYKNHYVKQTYLPDNLKDRKYYIKCDNKIENNLNKVHEEMIK